MATLTPIPVSSAEDFKLLLRELVSDLAHANDYRTLFKNIVEAQETYGRGMVKSQAFWGTALGAMESAAFYGLSRAYDQHADSLNLRTLLKVIWAKPSFLTFPSDFDTAQLRADLESVSHKSSSEVKNLMMWRHKFFAHRDPGFAVTRNLSEKFPITWEQFDALLDNALTILNRYDYTFFGNMTSRHVHGHEDYLHVLKTLQAAADIRAEEVRKMLREHGGGEPQGF